MKKLLFDYLIASNQKLWNAYITHPFVVAMKKGTLDSEQWDTYLAQDNVFLNYANQALALLFSKAETPEAKEFVHTSFLKAVESEISNQIALGIPPEPVPRNVANLAYTSYYYEVALRFDFLALLVTLSICPLGYEVIFCKSFNLEDFAHNKAYYQFAEFYYGSAYQKMCLAYKKLINSYDINNLHPSRLRLLVNIVRDVIKLEINFFNYYLPHRSQVKLEGAL